MAAKGSAVKTVTKRGNLIKVSWLLTSDASGDADENGSGASGFFYGAAYGKIKHFEIHPDGVAAPDADADYYVKDANGLDLLFGAGVDCGAGTHYRKGILATTGVTNSGQDVVLFNDTLMVIGDEMGNAKKCTVVLVIERTPDLY